MEKRRISLSRTKGYQGANLPTLTPYGAYPAKYSQIEAIHEDLDNMDNEIENALTSTSSKVRQVNHGFTLLNSVYFNTTTSLWTKAQADNRDTVGTHVIVEVIDKDNFIAGLVGEFEVANTLALGYWFTSATIAGELVDVIPDINNPMIQVLSNSTIRLLNLGIIEQEPEVIAPVTPDYTAITVGDKLQEVAEKVAGLQDLTYRKLYEIEITDPIAFIDITKDLDGNDLDLRVGFKVSYYLLADVDAAIISGIQINGITDDVYEYTNLGRNYLIWYGTRFGTSGGISLNINGRNPDVLLHFRGEYGTKQPGTITGNPSSQRIRQNIQSVTSFRLLTDGYIAGSKIVIYGT